MAEYKDIGKVELPFSHGQLILALDLMQRGWIDSIKEKCQKPYVENACEKCEKRVYCRAYYDVVRTFLNIATQNDGE